MAFSTRDRTETTLSEINVTPMVDVMLVLLIIFMVTAPMMSSSVEVDLQEATVSLPPTADEHLIISITAEGKIFVADTLTDIAILSDRVKETMRTSAARGIAIRGDKSVPYGAVLELVDRLRAAEIHNVGLVMDPPETPAELKTR